MNPRSVALARFEPQRTIVAAGGIDPILSCDPRSGFSSDRLGSIVAIWASPRAPYENPGSLIQSLK